MIFVIGPIVRLNMTGHFWVVLFSLYSGCNVKCIRVSQIRLLFCRKLLDKVEGKKARFNSGSPHIKRCRSLKHSYFKKP